ncbi:flavin-containing monooxygenase [Aspergillus tanneri]|uniref:FAD/NAD(P)-binding domain-containing protein n=1 Tax=Aspergillus tanneri TaxID=1220188 RepID=A0A5M9MQ74_9EURO|nr:uncharacterized protein ATNIH1004_003939 [Aspergillus tanneri]KAA8648056.1 hypothetical protein ATNIH1004_003939 [Aspergillus tanneri]
MPDRRITRHVDNKNFARSTVVIIGAGVAGLCVAIDLLRRTPCRNFVILEKGSQPQEYVIHIAEEYGLYKYIRFNSVVQEARWDDAQMQWTVGVAVSGGKDSEFVQSYELTTDFLVSAVGQLNLPRWPTIAGLDNFTGKMMHSARWDWTYDFSGKRVAIIGNGATAVQIIPELANSVLHLSVYQRTPNWTIPRYDWRVSSFQKFLLSRFPPFRWLKRSLCMLYCEATHTPVTNSQSMFSQQVRRMTMLAIQAQLPDKPDLWEKLIPNYPPGCKRILITDDYYPALNQKHVDLDTRPIRSITKTGIETEDGQIEEFDLIVLATGFRTVEFMSPIRVFGRQGRPLAELWKDGAQAYRGVTVEDMPNFGMLYGPNTNLGHNSIILMIEAQSRYLSVLINEVLRARKSGKTLSLVPRPEVVHSYNEDLQARLAKSSFADPNCQSWYKTESGRITNNWPSRVVRYQKDMDRVYLDEYLAEGTGKELVKGKKVYLGRVVEESPVSYATLMLGLVGVVVGGAYMNGYMSGIGPGRQKMRDLFGFVEGYFRR